MPVTKDFGHWWTKHLHPRLPFILVGVSAKRCHKHFKHLSAHTIHTDMDHMHKTSLFPHLSLSTTMELISERQLNRCHVYGWLMYTCTSLDKRSIFTTDLQWSQGYKWKQATTPDKQSTTLVRQTKHNTRQTIIPSLEAMSRTIIKHCDVTINFIFTGKLLFGSVSQNILR